MSSATSNSAPEPPSPADCAIQFYTSAIKRDTFANRKAAYWLRQHLPEGDTGTILDACAGLRNGFDGYGGEVITNDLNGEADHCIDVCDLSDEFKSNRFRAVIYDPPYNSDLADRLYDSPFPGYGTDVKEELVEVLQPGGKLLQLGFSGAGIPKAWGGRRESVTIFNQFGCQRDIVGIVDRYEPSTANKHPADSTPAWELREATESANIAINDGKFDTAGCTEEVGVGITYVDEPVDADPFAVAKIRQCLSGHIAGYTLLATWADAFEDATADHHLTRNAGKLKGVGLTAMGGDPAPDTCIPIVDLDESTFDRQFDTVVFVPPKQYLSASYYRDGENQGKIDGAARERFHELLRPGGKFIQIGHNTTGMSEEGYLKETVEAFIPLSEYNAAAGQQEIPYAQYLLVERKPGDEEFGGEHPLPYYVPCTACGERFPADPSVFEDCCPTCGALPDQYCVDEDGEVLHDGMHERRDQLYEDNHPEKTRCPGKVTGNHELLRPELYHPRPASPAGIPLTS
jgi:hypothetical protein